MAMQTKPINTQRDAKYLTNEDDYLREMVYGFLMEQLTGPDTFYTRITKGIGVYNRAVVTSSAVVER